MTVEYTLHLTIHGETRTLTITGDTTTDLAAEVHRHARGQLGGSRVDVHLDGDSGTITNHGAVVGTFALDAKTEPQPTDQPAEADGIRWGWTSHDLDYLTRLALSLDRWRSGDIQERAAAVRYAITEHILTAQEPPTRRELVGVGIKASDRHVRAEMHHHGWDSDNIAAGPGAMPSYQRYWTARPGTSPENVITLQAVDQILPLLTNRQRQAIEALRDTGDYALAAAKLHVAPGTFRVLISTARRRFLASWHEGETPSGIWRTDKHLYSRAGDWRGKPRLTVSQVEGLRDRYHSKEKTLTALAEEAGVHKSTLSALFSGRCKPAPDPELEAAA